MIIYLRELWNILKINLDIYCSKTIHQQKDLIQPRIDYPSMHILTSISSSLHQPSKAHGS